MDPFFSQHFQHNPQLMFHPLYPEETQPLTAVQYLTHQPQSLFIQPTFTSSQHPSQNIFPYTYHNTFQTPQLLANNPYNANTQQSFQPTYYGIPQYQEQASSSQPQISQPFESKIMGFMIETRSSLQQLEFQIMQLSDKIKEQCKKTLGPNSEMAIEEQREATETQGNLPQTVQEAMAETITDPEETALLCNEEFHSIEANMTTGDKEPPLSPSMQIAIQVLMSGFPPNNAPSSSFNLPPPPAPFEISIPPIVYHRRGGRKTNSENPPIKTPTKRKAPKAARTKRAPKGKNKLPP